MLMAVCLIVNICVTTHVCVISRSVANSRVSDDEHFCDESPDTCVCCFQVRCWQQCVWLWTFVWGTFWHLCVLLPGVLLTAVCLIWIFVWWKSWRLCVLILGVLLTAVCLITEMCDKSPDTLHHFRKVSRLGCALYFFLKCLLTFGFTSLFNTVQYFEFAFHFHPYSVFVLVANI